ncbi:hypothetical protein ACHAXR_008721 [Thalassiosira sp. AJA248-18]
MCHHRLRRLCQGAILVNAIPCSLLYPSISSAFELPRVYSQARYQSSFSQVLQMTSSTKNEEKSYIDKLALILINSKREQLVARSYGRSVYYTPGGKRELGESDEEALTRECIEELSVDLSTSTKTPTTIERYGVFEAQAYGKPEGTMVRISCYRVLPRDAELELSHLVKASEEVEELAWVSSSFDKEKLTVTGIMILEDLKERGLID